MRSTRAPGFPTRRTAGSSSFRAPKRKALSSCGDPALLAYVQGDLARAALDADDVPSARRHVLVALEALQDLGAGLASSVDIELRSAWKEVHTAAVDVAFRSANPEVCYDLLERTRALAHVRALHQDGDTQATVQVATLQLDVDAGSVGGAAGS